MNTRPLSYSVLFGTTLILSACSLAPGLHIEDSELNQENTRETAAVELIPITPKLLAVEAALKTPAAIPAELLGFRPTPYRIGTGDILQIVVWDHPELSMPAAPSLSTPTQPTVGQSTGFEVEADGSITFPYAGKVNVVGKTPSEFALVLQERLKNWIPNPQITVNPVRVHSAKITLSGAFERATEQMIPTSQLTLAAAIGNAGVKLQDANLSGLTLRRGGQDYVIDIDALSATGKYSLSSIYLKAGDHIHLPFNYNRKIYVMGEVVRPTSIIFNGRSVPLADAISYAGSIRQETAAAQAIYVLRHTETSDTGKSTQVFQLDARSPSHLALASRFEVKPQDIVFVGPSKVTRWNRVITQLLPTSQIFYMGTSAANQANTLRQ